jgi:hypothetical protein
MGRGEKSIYLFLVRIGQGRSIIKIETSSQISMDRTTPGQLPSSSSSRLGEKEFSFFPIQFDVYILHDLSILLIFFFVCVYFTGACQTGPLLVNIINLFLCMYYHIIKPAWSQLEGIGEKISLPNRFNILINKISCYIF